MGSREAVSAPADGGVVFSRFSGEFFQDGGSDVFAEGDFGGGGEAGEVFHDVARKGDVAAWTFHRKTGKEGRRSGGGVGAGTRFGGGGGNGRGGGAGFFRRARTCGLAAKRSEFGGRRIDKIGAFAAGDRIRDRGDVEAVR